MESQSTSVSSGNRSSAVDRILDATRAAVILHGVRRTTVQDIAARAGISRMTFYRQLGSVDHAVLQTLTREFRNAVAAATGHATGGTGRDRLVSFVLEGVRLYAADEMVASILERDPELLIPYLSDRFGASQELILAALAPLLAAGVADGSIAARSATGTMVLLIMQAVALPARILEARAEYRQVLEELELMLHRYLAPEATR
ncbi:MAG: TetR/AcrR family transcriptional regulator [Renibacterium sp.]|nr:TetR/AcrR family transcriptional regulator [Renibacterium sp.]